MSNKNIGLEFIRVADENPDYLAIATDTLPITYDNLKSVVESFALRMSQLGIDRDAFVIMHTNDMVAALTGVLASSLLGCRFAFASKTLALAPELTATHVIATSEMKLADHLRATVIDESWTPHKAFETEKPLANYPGSESEDDPWLYTATSGTTGLPKIIALSQRIVWERSMAARADYVPHYTKFVPLFGCTARPFLSRALSALLSPCTIVEGKDFEFWHSQGANLVVGSPEQVRDELQGKELAHRFEQLHVGGGKLDPDLAQELLQHFETVVNLYGASETNRTFRNVFSLDSNGNLQLKGEKLDSEIEIVDDNGLPCDIGEMGEVRIRNSYLALGYVNNRDAQARNFRDGWFYPGDIAEWGVNGELIIIARVDDLINLGGTKVDARTTENALRMVKGVKDAIAFKNPRADSRSELVAFVELEPLTHVQKCLDEAKWFCLRTLSRRANPGRIFQIDKIPVNDRGQKDRLACISLVLEKMDETQR